jgi:peroxiredoxin (alkyl hydroperoxide reductase subunit C)
MRRKLVGFLVAALACVGPQARDDVAEVALGPVDGLDLPATDTGRVRVGDAAPDFSLASLAGPVVTLSSFRGASNVVLVFYRGHW